MTGTGLQIADCRLQIGRPDRCDTGPKRKRGIANVIIPILLLAFTASIRADAPDVKPVTVPFEQLKTGHITVMIKVNGEGPYRVIFDTGSPITLLDSKIAKDSGLLEKGPKPLFGLFGSVNQVKVKEL